MRASSFNEPPLAAANRCAISSPRPRGVTSRASMVQPGSRPSRPRPRSSTPSRTLPSRAPAQSSIEAPSHDARSAFSTRLTTISSASDGSANTSGQSASTATLNERRTSERLSRAERKRSAGGTGSGRGTTLPASSWPSASRSSMRRCSREASTSSSPTVASASDVAAELASQRADLESDRGQRRRQVVGYGTQQGGLELLALAQRFDVARARATDARARARA